MLLAVLVYAIGQPGAERNHVGFQSVYLVLAAGVAGVVPRPATCSTCSSPSR